MGNSFDELFNEFLGGELNKKNDNKPSKLNNISDSIEKVINAITNNIGGDLDLSNDLELSNDIDKNLGEPSEVRYYEEDGLYFIESTWETEIGVIRKTLVSDMPLDGSVKEVEEEIGLSLEEQLEEAIQNEEYEKAAKLRDSIKKEKKKKKKL